MTHFPRMPTLVLGAMAMSFLWGAPPAAAAGVEDILGTWKVVTNFNGREIESDIVFEAKDGVLTGAAEFQVGGGGRDSSGGAPGNGGARRTGTRELLDVKYEGDTLSWGMLMPRAGNEPLRTTVTVSGETFEGATKIPFGEAKVSGRKSNPEAELKLQETIKTMLGDWDIITTFNGKDSQSKMRLTTDEERGFRLAILMPGATLDVRRVRFDGTTLSFTTSMPFVGDEPARAQMKVAGGKCEGTIATVFGEIPIRGELIDTAKLVLAPYDDPQAVIGSWDVVANVRGDESKVKLAIEPNGERLKGIVETNDGTFESSDVDYKKVGEKLGRVRLTIVIPSLGEKPQSFELIFSGDGFEGEELHSNGAIYLSGTRAAG